MNRIILVWTVIMGELNPDTLRLEVFECVYLTADCNVLISDTLIQPSIYIILSYYIYF